MKKERDCGGNYPIYPTYMPNMMPGMPMGVLPSSMNGASYPINMPNYPMSNNYQGGNNSFEQQLANLNNQINSLERRVSNLENVLGNTNKYNTSNYQML